MILAAPDGKTLARTGLRYELLKIESRYQWYRRDGSWGYEPIKLTRRIADGQIDVAADKPGRIAVPVQWGRYRLEVSSADANGPVTSDRVRRRLVHRSDRRHAGHAGDRARQAGVPAGRDHDGRGHGAHRRPRHAQRDRRPADQLDDAGGAGRACSACACRSAATGATAPMWSRRLRRPLDAKAQRMPGRAIGVQWFSIDRQAKTLKVDMNLPQLQRPNGTLRVPVKVNGLAAGEEARIVVAAVDVGILNLTNYKPPAPDDYYLGQRRLTAELRDLYGQLIDGMQGTRGQIKTGGDAAAELGGSPPSQAPLALYSGIVTVKPDGTAEVSFDIPAFAGTVRVMAVAWSKDKVGRAVGDVTVRDPVVLTATLPRFLLTGDRGTMHLELDNVEGPAGEYSVAVRADGALNLGNQTGAEAASGRQAAHQPDRAGVELDGGRGRHRRCRSPGPAASRWSAAMRSTVKPATQVLTRRTVRPLAKGESFTLSNDLFADLVPGTGAVALSVGPSTALDAATLLKALDRYPFGCSEQITSRALPLLYVNELAAEQHLALDTGIDQRIRDAIDRLLARQSSNGSFGLWGVGGDDGWLDAYVTDFLTRARERGFAVPDTAFKLALDRLRNEVNTAQDVSKDGGRDLAYALYVLARNGVAPLGDLRYHRRRQAQRSGNADRQGADRRGARHAGRPGARRARLCRGARPHQAAGAAGAVQPRRLRLDAARRRGADHAGERGGRLAADHRQRGAARRAGALDRGLHLDAGAGLAGARRARAGEGHRRRCRSTPTASSARARSTAT